MNTFKTSSTAFHSMLLLFACLLVSCGGGGGGGASTSVDLTQNPSGFIEVSPISDSSKGYADSDIVSVPFANTNNVPTSNSAIQSGLFTAAGAKLDPSKLRWISQYAAGCDADFAFCGPTSLLMGAIYLKAGALNLSTLPSKTGLGIEEGGSWIRDVLKDKGMTTGSCGRSWGPDDSKNLAIKLGLEAEIFDGVIGATDADIEKWISDALGNDSPVVARVHYQNGKNTPVKGENGNEGTTCKPTGTREAIYQGGSSSAIEMKECWGLVDGIIGQYGHWVLISEIDSLSITVYDPDPFAANELGGIRKYTKDSFLNVLKNQ